MTTPDPEPPPPLRQLTHDTHTRRTIDARRDHLIAQARVAGHTWKAIAQAADLTQQATLTAARRANSGELPYVGTTETRNLSTPD